MSTETLKNSIDKDVPIIRVNADVLKNKIIKRKKKQRFQNRIILSTVLVSIGLIGYFVG